MGSAFEKYRLVNLILANRSPNIEKESRSLAILKMLQLEPGVNLRWIRIHPGNHVKSEVVLRQGPQAQSR